SRATGPDLWPGSAPNKAQNVASAPALADQAEGDRHLDGARHGHPADPGRREMPALHGVARGIVEAVMAAALGDLDLDRRAVRADRDLEDDPALMAEAARAIGIVGQRVRARADREAGRGALDGGDLGGVGGGAGRAG